MPRAAPPQELWFLPLRRCHGEHRIAFLVAGAFALAGLLWVLSTDVLLYALTRDPVLVARIETAKGWSFVGLAALLLYVVTLRCARQLCHAQATLAAVFECIADGVLLLGRERTIVHANPAALRLLRAESPRELLGMGAPEFARRFRVSRPDGTRVPPEQFISHRVFEEGGTLHYKAVLYPNCGNELIISATAAAVNECGYGPTELVVSVLHDITASEQFEQLRDRFCEAAAHSLKTPIAVIKAHVQSLRPGEEIQLQRSTAAIERQCGRIDRLVQNLLVLARARSRTLRLHPHELPLAPLLLQVAAEMSAAWPRHRLSACATVSPRVHADGERLAIALRNLIEDACRSSAAGAQLDLLLEQREARAMLGVRYAPLAAEELSPDAPGREGDAGIGRCVAELVAHAHGGALCEEIVGNVTTLWLALPLGEESSAGH